MPATALQDQTWIQPRPDVTCTQKPSAREGTLVTGIVEEEDSSGT